MFSCTVENLSRQDPTAFPSPDMASADKGEDFETLSAKLESDRWLLPFSYALMWLSVSRLGFQGYTSSSV